MCRPPCCDDSGGSSAGIAAVAITMVAALIAAKIGPIVARVVHTVVEVIRLAALTTGLVLALAAITWVAITLTRWQLQRKALAGTRTQVAVGSLWEPTEPSARPGCLACGGTGTVLRAVGSGRYRPGECPACEPIKRAG